VPRRRARQCAAGTSAPWPQWAYSPLPGPAPGRERGRGREQGSLTPSWGERREAEQAIGRHEKRDVVVPARLAQLTKYELI
jgi:hypothetical protein